MNPIKMRNYTTQQQADTSMQRIMQLLRQIGADDVTVSYDDLDRVTAIRYTLKTRKFGLQFFKVPYNLGAVKLALEEQHRRRWIKTRITDPYRIERIALKNALEWLHAEVSMLGSGMYGPEELMFGWMLTDDRVQTTFERAVELHKLPPPADDAPPAADVVDAGWAEVGDGK